MWENFTKPKIIVCTVGKEKFMWKIIGYIKKLGKFEQLRLIRIIKLYTIAVCHYRRYFSVFKKNTDTDRYSVGFKYRWKL